MKHSIDTILYLIEGGNKYKVIDKQPTKGSQFKGCYQVGCIDFWCPEELGDGITCWKEGEKIWIASFFADFMPIWQSAEDYQQNGFK